MDILKGDLQGKIRTNAKVRVMRYNGSRQSYIVNLHSIGEVVDVHNSVLLYKTSFKDGNGLFYVYLDDFKVNILGYRYEDLIMRYKRILMFSLILKEVQLNLIKNVIDIYSKINYDEGNSQLLKVVDKYLFKPLIELDKYNNVNSKLLHHKLKVIKRYSKDLIEDTLYEHSCENCGEYFLEDDNEYFNQYRCCDRVCYGELVGVSIY